MRRFIRLLLSRLSEDALKGELRRRGYATDISVTFTSFGEPREFKAIGKNTLKYGYVEGTPVGAVSDEDIKEMFPGIYK